MRLYMWLLLCRSGARTAWFQRLRMCGRACVRLSRVAMACMQCSQRARTWHVKYKVFCSSGFALLAFY